MQDKTVKKTQRFQELRLVEMYISGRSSNSPDNARSRDKENN